MSHFDQRMAERYGFRMEREDLEVLRDQCRTKVAPLYERMPDRTERRIVWHAGRPLLVVYDRRVGDLVTVLKRSRKRLHKFLATKRAWL